MPSKEFIGAATGTALSSVGTVLQTNEVLQTASLIITIAGGVITLAIGIFNLILKIRNWYKKAKADGKITDDEVDELKDIVNGDGKQLIDTGKTVIKNIKDKETK